MNITKSKRFRSAICLMQVALMFSATHIFAAMEDDSAWTLISEKSVQNQSAAASHQLVNPSKYQKAQLDLARFSQQIKAASQGATGLIVIIPNPDGGLERFRITPAGDMHPDLQLWFAREGMPMQTYKGVSLDKPGNTIRMDFGGPGGLHASVFSVGKSYYVDPLFKNDTENYASYYRHDYPSSDDPLSCQLHDKPVDQSWPAELQSTGESQDVVAGTDGNIRTFRLAVAATGEYTQFHGGTTVAGQAAIVTSVSRVNQIYERDLSIHMELIANNISLVYTNPATDPYTNGNGGTMLGENQANIDSVIGSANYDIGHVFSTGGGGVAYLGVICNAGFKAGGVTGRGAPVGDPFDIDFVAHEMGHQWGGNHTFNSPLGSCSGGNRSELSAYEPGSGSTIQAYAGICGADDLQPNSD
ncbi:MAG TPA: zinc-dependent metalloprotease family protein, partial [Xanthomonadales bacterium]|nr:zinc-dependent metalloprotease family protein [Xanthomonadales bacterium]